MKRSEGFHVAGGRQACMALCCGQDLKGGEAVILEKPLSDPNISQPITDIKTTGQVRAIAAGAGLSV